MDRQNFGGVFRVNQRHETTKLTLSLVGFSIDQPDRMDADGYLSMLADDGTIAAGDSFEKLMECWGRKHPAAAYVPAMRRGSPREFRYGSEILICEGTNLLLVLKALADGHLYLDPAVKAESWSSGKPKVHRRNQFRIRRQDLPRLYHSARVVPF